MRTTIPIVIISLLLIGLPVATALPTIQQSIHEPLLQHNIPAEETQDEPPDWATGNFTGVWGINAMGQPLEPQGLILGYYGNHRFLGAFTNTTAVNGYLAGITFGPFMFGVIANITGEGRAPFVGLGGQNGTTQEFYYRIMGIVGPTLYLYGLYHPY